MVLILILEFCAVFFGWRAGSARRGQFVFLRGPGGCDECTYDRTPRHDTTTIYTGRHTATGRLDI